MYFFIKKIIVFQKQKTIEGKNYMQNIILTIYIIEHLHTRSFVLSGVDQSNQSMLFNIYPHCQ